MDAPAGKQSWSEWLVQGYAYTIREEGINPKTGIIEVSTRKADALQAATWGEQYSELRPQSIQYGMLGHGDNGKTYYVVSYTNDSIPVAGHRINVALTSKCTNSWTGCLAQAAETKAIQLLNNRVVDGGLCTVATSEEAILNYVQELNQKTQEKVLSVSATVLNFGEEIDKLQAIKEFKRLSFDMQLAIESLAKVSKTTFVKGNQKAWNEQIKATSNLKNLVDDTIKALK